MVIVVMGAAGAGKSTIGAAVAARLGYRFVDADDLHSPESFAKMAAGVPLTDADRSPWLEALAAEIDGYLHRGEDVVLACSALKREYRVVLFRDPARMRLVYLRGSPALLEARLRARLGHRVGPNLLESQLAILDEPPDAITVDVDASVDAIAAEVVRRL